MMTIAQAAKRRRSVADLERRLEAARSKSERAQANFELALFHDNNNREAKAIPYYESALNLGLEGQQKTECLAWLGSSLFKTGRRQEALDRLRESQRATQSSELIAFLHRLERRIRNE
jgi:tetratricopeptide (TPR) repeat protein